MLKRLSLALTLAALVVFAGCDDSSNSADELATLHGTLTLHGTWPQEGDIQVSLFPQWDVGEPMAIAPGGPPEFHTENLTGATPTDTVHAIAYRIDDVNPGEYPALVVGWRNGGTIGLDEPVLGMHGADFAVGDTLPTAVTISAGDDLTIDFDGWLDLVPAGAVVSDSGFVRGTVVFPADWPQGFSMGLFALLMTSGDPAQPTSPVAGAMQPVTAESPDFELPVNLSAGPFSGHLAVYGYTFVGSPWDSFFGGHGWDWQAAEPALVPIELEREDSVLEGLTILCRSQD